MRHHDETNHRFRGRRKAGKNKTRCAVLMLGLPSTYYYCEVPGMHHCIGATDPRNLGMSGVWFHVSLTGAPATLRSNPTGQTFPWKLDSYSFTAIMRPEGSPLFLQKHSTGSWGSSIKSTPSHYNSLISFLILSSHLRLYLLNDLFSSDCPNKILYAFLVSPICATSHAHFSLWFEYPNNIWWIVQIIKLPIT